MSPSAPLPPAPRDPWWQQAWRSAWQGVGHPADGLLEALMARYQEPERAYHTLQHLGECLALHAAHAASAEHPGEVALALWFHDAVYDLHASDNEARSAQWAREAMDAAGAGADAAARVHALVMATRHSALPEGRDAELLVDIDLAILGAAPARFAEYERQIRVEYAHVPPEVFEPRRRGILGGFLQRSPLYRTPALRAAFEAAAQRNLQAAIAAGA